jgi:hypothetical protein
MKSPGLTREEERAFRARCPMCGSAVFVPRKPLRERFGGDNGPDDPQVWCVDMGWIGFLSECDDFARR